MVQIAVLMIADSRTPEAEACAEILGALPGAAAPRWVPDDPRYVQAAIREARTAALVLCGGDSVSLPRGIREGIAAEITRAFPGFGELIRRGLGQGDSLAAVLTDARALAAGQLAVFALPASPAACQLAGPLISSLRPTMQAMLSGLEVHLKTPSPTPASADAPGGEDAAAAPLPPAPTASAEAAEDDGERLEAGTHVDMIGGGGEAEDDAPRGRWEQALAAMDARLDRDLWYELPDTIEDIPAAREVLEAASQRAAAVLADGRKAGVFGFPDLLRPTSKVMMVIETRGVLEVLALHRHPSVVGLVGRGSVVRTGSAEAEAEARTAHPTPYGGELFAVGEGVVYLERDGRVYEWDGRREHDMGSEAQATASLVLRWSER